MRVLTFGSDRNLFKSGSEVRSRILIYGRIVEELHIVVLALKKLKLEAGKIGDNIFIYPTNSRSRLGYFIDAWRLGKKIAERHRLDLVSAQDPFENGLIGWWLARRFSLPLQLQIHTDFLSPYFAVESLNNRLRVKLAKWLLPRADCVRVVSQRIADSLKSVGWRLKTKPVFLPVFIDLEKLRTAPIKTDLHQKYPQFEKIILMASRLTKEKNINLAIEAMAEVVSHQPKVGLIIVGDGPVKESLKLEAKSYKLEASIIFEPWTTDLISYYKTADLFLNTSWYEGYGRTLVEAAAAGLPVISTDVGVAREIAIAVVAPGDKMSLTLAVIRTCQSDGRSQVKPFSYPPRDEYLSAYEESFRACLKKSRGRRLLVITQAVDRQNTVLGFFHRWLEEFAKHCDELIVICLEKGDYDLPVNVQVLSLGKEELKAMSTKPEALQKLKYVWRFYQYLWRERQNYDLVFVHMNQEYVLLAGWWWRLTGKKVFLWRNHPLGGWLTNLAVAFADLVFCTSKYSYTARFSKTKIMPVGIDTDYFNTTTPPNLFNIVAVGRMAPIKYNLEMVKTLKLLVKKDSRYKLTFCGSYDPKEKAYYDQVREEGKELVASGNLVFYGSVPNNKLLSVYEANGILLNLTPTGSFDKVMFEALSCQRVVVAFNREFREIYKEGGGVGSTSPEEVADKIGKITALDQNDLLNTTKASRIMVVEKYSLKKLLDDFVLFMK